MSFSAWKTGRWRMRFSVIRDMQSRSRVSGLMDTTVVVMISPTFVVWESLPLIIILRA